MNGEQRPEGAEQDEAAATGAGVGAAPEAGSDPSAGRGIVRASVGGTVVFTALAVLAVVAEATVPAFVVLSLAMFFAGSLIVVVAFLTAVDRSRTEAIGVGGLFFGAGSAPTRVQLLLMGSLAVEVAVGIAVAVIRIYTAVAFGTLAPMWALGLAGLWVARHGRFPARAPELTRSGRRDVERRQATGGDRRPAPPSRRRPPARDERRPGTGRRSDGPGEASE